MALHWRPLGPEPAETYWRRRALVAAAALAVLVLVVWAGSGLGGGDEAQDRLAAEPSASSASRGPDPAATPTPDPSATATPSASASPSAQTTCEDAAVQLVTAADKESYAVGERPRLELRVTNTGGAPCSLDLGQSAVELTVVSGSDRIWSSDDCAPGGEAEVVTLTPGEPAVRRVTWGGRRSLPACEGPKAAAQPGTYRVTGRVSERDASGGAFRITG